MLSLWQMTLSASAVILLTALLRGLVANRLPRRMYIALWDIALLAGLIPFRVPWENLSRFIQWGKTTMARVDGAAFSAPSQTPGLLMQGMGVPVTEGVPAVIPTAAPLPPVSSVRDSLNQAVQPLRETVQSAPDWLWQTLGAVWAVGAVVLAAVLLYRWAACCRAFAEALPCEDQRAAAFLREHRLLRRIRVRMSGCISSPLSYGLLHPVILLPARMAGTDDQTLGYVLTHEFMHIRALDMLRKWMMLLVLCLHWLNPLAWVMLRLYNRDMELMCDERVVRCLGGRRAYCLTLLDMEVQRSNLTMGTCFSVTGIEERIKVMKNRKHQGILSIALAFAIFFGAAMGAMTSLPLAGAEDASPRMIFSRETWQGTYARYEGYGLGYDEKNGTITFDGQVVRYFEDMWPIDETGKAGACFIYEGGAVDVYGVREYPEYIRRNPDGSFDPSGTLIGLRAATQEEYDAMTAWLKSESVSQTTAVLQVAEGTAYSMVDATPVPADPAATIGPASDATPMLVDLAATPAPMAKATVSPVTTVIYGDPYENVEWWTAEEYRAWMENERIALQQLVEGQAQAWTPSTGWFIWTQEKADEAMARYESILQDIERGIRISKPVNGDDGSVMFAQDPGSVAFISGISDAMWGSAEELIPSVDAISGDSVEQDAVAIAFLGQSPEAPQYGEEDDLGSDAEGKVVLVAVSPGDEWRYTPEQWTMIQALIEQGIIQWQVPASVQLDQENTAEAYELSRMETWRQTIAPYAPFGLSCALDTTMDLVHLYWNGREVRGVFDPERGMWITEHAGNGLFPDGAKELIAVYENGVLIGLRETDEEESNFWNKLRDGA